MASTRGSRRSTSTIVSWLVLALLVAVVALLVVLNGSAIWSSFFPPEAKSVQGKEIRNLYDIVFIIAAIIFFVVEGLIVWTVIRYRRKPGDNMLPPQTHGNNLAEITWTLVPTVIVIFLFVISWSTLNSVEAVAADPALKVRAVAQQFNWSFEYLPANANEKTAPVFKISSPEGAQGGLTLPAGQTTHLFLHSPDVIHALYVPQFLFKRDVVPGIVNQFDLTIPADDAGQTYRGQCAELCGIGHRAMVFDVHVVSPAEFQAWYQSQVAAANATPPPAPSGQAAGPAVPIAAQGVKFDKATLEGPATGFTIHFENKDASIPHDVDILDASGQKVVDNKDFPGVAAQDYAIKPLPAGTYKFECSIHPAQMSGTLTVQ